jgi:HEAT repeat protein
MSEILNLNELASDDVAEPVNATALKTFNLLVKAVKAKLVYPASSPLPQKFLEELLASLKEALLGTESLIYKIDSNKILFEQSEVYRSQGKSDDFAFAFFRDGIKSIEFHKEVSENELNTFVEIISSVIRGSITDDDLASLLWEADFANISYQLMDDIFNIQGEEFGLDRPNAADDSSLAEVQNLFNEEITPMLLNRKQHDTLMEKQIAKGQYSPFADVLDHSSESIKELMSFESADKTAIIRMIENDQNFDANGYIIKLLFEILVLETDQSDYREVLLLIGKVHDDFIKTAEYNSASKILTRMREMSEVYERIGDIHQDAIRELINSFTDAKKIKQLVDSLNLQEEINQSAVVDYLKMFPETVVPHLIDALGLLKHFSGRRAVCKALGILAVDKIELLGKSVDDPRWYVVRNIVMILGQIGNPRALDYFRKAIKHPDLRVRKETLASITKIEGESGHEILIMALSDESEKLQLMAARELIKQKALKAYAAVENIIKSKNFINRSDDLIKSFLETIALLGGARGFALLKKMAARNSLFSSAKQARLKKYAINTLGYVQSPEAINFLDKIAKSRNKELSRAAKHSINILLKGATD